MQQVMGYHGQAYGYEMASANGRSGGPRPSIWPWACATGVEHPRGCG